MRKPFSIKLSVTFALLLIAAVLVFSLIFYKNAERQALLSATDALEANTQQMSSSRCGWLWAPALFRRNTVTPMKKLRCRSRKIRTCNHSVDIRAMTMKSCPLTHLSWCIFANGWRRRCWARSIEMIVRDAKEC